MNVLAVIGWSGSGKTSLIEQLLISLKQAGLRLSAVKHSHHDISLEPAGKDSARMRAAGAEEVLLVSPYRYVLTRELRDTPEPPLAELLQRFSAVDLVLVEGYKWESLCKLEVYRPALQKTPVYLSDPQVLAVASDVARPADAPAGLVWLDLNQLDRIGEWLLAALQNGKFSYPPKES